MFLLMHRDEEVINLCCIKMDFDHANYHKNQGFPIVSVTLTINLFLKIYFPLFIPA